MLPDPAPAANPPQVLDFQPGDAHLLLQAKNIVTAEKSEYLCGHDEQHWFVAAIPEDAEAESVQEAKDALKPQAVWDAMEEFHVPLSQRDLRRTDAFVRQGEWFFVPRPNARIVNREILRNEPMRRGGGKPHLCQFMYRFGGEEVMVCDEYPNGLVLKEYFSMQKDKRGRHLWQRMVRGAAVFVKGAIRHPDHETIWLPDWHEVFMNRESEAKAMKDVAFLD